MDVSKELVFNQLDNAFENGYTFEGMSNEEIAIDLTSYSAVLEDANLEELEAFVKEWRATK